VIERYIFADKKYRVSAQQALLVEFPLRFHENILHFLHFYT